MTSSQNTIMDDRLSQLHSSKSSIRLEQIAALRARGIGDHIDLPQLVVCGDQSAGKSSVLEGLTGIPFPRQDGLCTKFATEITLLNTPTQYLIKATILPDLSRSEASKTLIRNFERQLDHFDQLPDVISAAGALMGVRGYGDIKTGPAFARDVLRIEVSGPVGLHLTVVDLPGLISVANEEQTEEDVEIVQSLVNEYISNQRTIILAVVQASNDIANQRIIQKSRKVDETGQRTVGIITKPDLINQGTESRIALLAKNQDTTKLKLGYFLVKNPAPTEMRESISSQMRHENERRYFQSSPWKEQALNSDRVGINSLRTYLQTLLDQHIDREIPKVRQEIKRLMNTTEAELAQLGKERPTIGHLRLFLCQLAMRFHNLAASALNGTYNEADSVFFSVDENDQQSSRRLRSRIHTLNTSFSDYMRDYGEKRKLVGAADLLNDATEEIIEVEEDQNDDDDGEKAIDGPISVNAKKMQVWVKQIYRRSRGKELPGNYNYTLLAELFHIQSSRWHSIAENHLNTVHKTIVEFINSALAHITTEARVLAEVSEIVINSFNEQFRSAEAELKQLCKDEQKQPITYNHYYTDNVQKSRQDATRKILRKAMDETRTHDWNGKFHVSNNSYDAERLLSSLQNRIIVNMDSQACSEALAGLKAYYKVAMKTFVDNVCRQVIERHLLDNLSDTFCPEKVALYSDEELERIAAESPSTAKTRARLQELYGSLVESLKDLRR